jgi:hypothetical protein
MSVRAIFDRKLWYVGENLSDLVLTRYDEEGEVEETIAIDYGSPDVIIDPTDGDIECDVDPEYR